MSEQAIILIPDISGFTDFTSSTEIDHSSHIINELLELIIESNNTDFTLAEIEGDAILFYRKGIPLQKDQLIDQCLRIFSNFHTRLKIIERDTVCQCGACQSASNLTLKFIVHYGRIKEIKIAQFLKATGVDMIIAHRLLKNTINSHEYILITNQCCEALGNVEENPAFKWLKSNQSYDSIGNIEFRYAALSDFKSRIPPPPVRPEFVVQKGDDNLEIIINAPLKTVYQTLINVDKRPEWLAGVDSIKREMTSERIGMRHNCIFMGLELVNTAIFNSYNDEHSKYTEQVEAHDIGLTIMVNYDLYSEGEKSTRMIVNVNWMNSELPKENKMGMIEAEKTNLDLFKTACEKSSSDNS